MGTTPAQAVAQLEDATADGRLGVWCEQLGIDLLVVFGSAADPERAAAARDLDVAVLLGEGGEAGDVLTVITALMDLTGCADVDVLDLRRAGPVVSEEALVGTLPLYERTPGLLAQLRDRAVMRRMDTDWLRRLDLELMAGG
jgi:predicted nucleotidyltransferase